MQALPRDFYDRDTTRVARELLGKFLVHRLDGAERIGKIVEVEAYLCPHDLAAHTSTGLKPLRCVSCCPPGIVYVFMIYGMSLCMNIYLEERHVGTEGVRQCKNGRAPN